MNWVLVLGDVMLDMRTSGEVCRCSPEAPVPVLTNLKVDYAPGGAGNVAMNLSAMGIRTRFFGRRSQDPVSDKIAQLLDAGGVIQDHWSNSNCPPEVKHRIAACNQQLVRLDTTAATYDPPEVLHRYLEHLQQLFAQSPAAVVVADYGKGALDGARKAISNLCTAHKVPLYVDTKPEHLSEYEEIFLLKPNLREAEEMVGPQVHPALTSKDPTEHAVVYAQALLRQKPDVMCVCVTAGAAGAVLAGYDWHVLVTAEQQEIADVTGAGDTFFAALVASIVRGHRIEEAGSRAATAASMAVARPGTVVIGGDELEDYILQQAGPTGKLMTADTVSSFAERRRRQHKTIGFANGCFDVVHPGHIHLLQQAKARCDVLILAINSDESVRRLKGEGRPLTPFGLRASSLLPHVDALVVFDDDTPIELIKAVRPHSLFKGDEYVEKTVVGADEVARRGGEVVFVPMLPEFSTTRIAEVFGGSQPTV